MMTEVDGKIQYTLIDFGISYSLKSEKEFKEIKGFIGTPRYASIAAHNNQWQTKKDDLEAFFYVLAFCYFKKLPWFKLHVEEKEKLKAIMKKKMKSH